MEIGTKIDEGDIIVQPHLITQNEMEKLSIAEANRMIENCMLDEYKIIVYVFKHVNRYIITLCWGDKDGDVSKEKFYLHEIEWIYKFVNTVVREELVLDGI